MAVAGSCSTDVWRSLQFAGASGDWNPIHLSHWAAGMVGMKGAIAHGMWSMSAAVETLTQRGVLPS